jgi:hypothetical protein
MAKQRHPPAWLLRAVMRALEKIHFPRIHTMEKEICMSRINSRDRYVRVAAAAATILFALTTIGAAGQAPAHHGHGGHGYTPPPVKSSYDPAKSVIRDHRTPAGSGASAIPVGTPRK